MEAPTRQGRALAALAAAGIVPEMIYTPGDSKGTRYVFPNLPTLKGISTLETVAAFVAAANRNNQPELNPLGFEFNTEETT